MASLMPHHDDPHVDDAHAPTQQEHQEEEEEEEEEEGEICSICLGTLPHWERVHVVDLLREGHSHRVRCAVLEQRVQPELPHVQSSSPHISRRKPQAGSSLGQERQGMGHEHAWF